MPVSIHVHHALTDGLHVAQFSAAPRGFARGFCDPKFRDEFLEDINLAVDVAKKLNAKKMCVVAGEEHEGLTKDEQSFGNEPELNDNDKHALIAFLKTF